MLNWENTLYSYKVTKGIDVFSQQMPCSENDSDVDESKPLTNEPKE